MNDDNQAEPAETRYVPDAFEQHMLERTDQLTERMGGEEAWMRLFDAFLARFDQMPEARRMETLADGLTYYLAIRGPFFGESVGDQMLNLTRALLAGEAPDMRAESMLGAFLQTVENS